MNPVSFILHYKATNTYALNVIAGAAMSKIDSPHLEVIFADRTTTLVESIQKALREQRKAVVVWSFYSPHFLKCVEDLHTVKQHVQDKNVLHFAGGVHATAETEATLRAGFDLATIGEGEKTVVQILQKILAGGDFRTVKGVAYIDGSGKFVSNGTSDLIELDDFPPFAPKIPRVNPIEITRGCVYACSFCQTPFMFKARFRHRSVENICEHVRFMQDIGARDVRFITPTSLSYGSNDNTVQPDKIEELLSSVHASLKSDGRLFFGTFPSEVRPEHVSPKALKIIKKYCSNNNIVMGGQSGSANVLNKNHRGHDVESIRRAVRYCVEEGFLPNVDLIFGLPGETPRDLKATLELADELTTLGARIHGHTFMPLPGTPLKNALPGHITQEAENKLHKLIARGKLYGQWKTQKSIAHELSRSSQ